MQVTVHNKVKVYNLTAGKSLPEWLSERRKNKKLAGSADYRLELLHDLEFPHFSRCIFRTENGTNLFAAGDYPSRIKCFDVNNLSMKYSFNADMPILSGVPLSADFRKFALRGEGRVLTIHHSAAIVDRLRVPHAQRALAYHPNTAELLSVGYSHEVFRISLETGCFVESYKTDFTGEDGREKGINSVEVFQPHGLAMLAGANGVVEAWDSRASVCAGKLCCVGAGAAYSGLDGELTNIAVDTSGGGLQFAVGTGSGHVLLYDIRLQKPLRVKDMMNGLPIVKSHFFQGKSTSSGESTHILTADTRSLRVWNKHNGSNFTTLETPADITDFTVLRSQHNLVEPFSCDDSGIICVCCDVPRVQVFFIPQLGVAPRWASFLDVITEELEEKNSSQNESGAAGKVVYDDYTFISNEEMMKLGMTANDLAEGKVRPSMHGAFIENGLYRELKAVVDPAAFSRYVAESKKEKVRDKWDNRISKFKRVAIGEAGPRREAEATSEDETYRETETAVLEAVKQDPRFRHAFSSTTSTVSTGFALDRGNPEYTKLLQTINERRAKAAARRQRYDDALFNIVADDRAESEHGGSRDDDDDGGEQKTEDEAIKGIRSSGKQQPQRQKRPKNANHDHENRGNETGKRGGRACEESRGNSENNGIASRSSMSSNARKVIMFEAKVSAKKELFTASEKQVHAARKKQRAMKLSLEDQLKKKLLNK